MSPDEANKRLAIHLKGIFFLSGNNESNFIGPVKAGLRLVMWGNSDKKATSCVFINDVNIRIGVNAECEIVILSPQSIDKELLLGDKYTIGYPGIKLGDFLLEDILGQWQGKVP